MTTPNSTSKKKKDLVPIVGPQLVSGRQLEKGVQTRGKTFEKPEPIRLKWLIGLFGYFLLLASFTLHRVYKLPDPVLVDSDSNYSIATSHDDGKRDGKYLISPLLTFSEGNARKIIRGLTNIGLRLAGTRQELSSIDYLTEQIQNLKRENKNPNLKVFDIHLETTSGSHYLEHVATPIYKMYQNVSNLIVILSCGEHCNRSGSLLVNSHFDSAMDSPGAADNGISVGVMFELIRVISQGKFPLNNKLVLLFNGAEETILDAADGFVKKSPFAKNIKAFINLDTMGNSGREVLFQTNSLNIVRQVAKAPHPCGTVISKDIFSSGVIPSLTDFKVFTENGHLVGVDFAFYWNNYVYHTMLDTEERIQKGSIQHMGENILKLTLDMINSDLSNFKETKEPFVYFDILGYFMVIYSWSTAQILNYVVSAFGLFFGLKSIANSILSLKPKCRSLFSPVLYAFKCLLDLGELILMAVSAIVSCFTVLFVVSNVFSKAMPYFSSPMNSILLYVPSSLFGIVYAHYGIRSILNRLDLPHQLILIMEKKIFRAQTTLYAFALLGLTQMEIASSYIFMIPCLFNATALAFQKFHKHDPNMRYQMHPLPYFISSTPSVFILDIFLALIQLVVPLTGRMGAYTPSDTIVACVVAIFTFLLVSPFLPLLYRLSESRLLKLIGMCFILTCGSIVHNLVMVNVHEDNSPQRLFIQNHFNLTSQETSLDVGLMSTAHPKPVLQSIRTYLGTSKYPKGRTRNQTFMDWAVVGPASRHGASFRFDLNTSVSDLLFGDFKINSGAPIDNSNSVNSMMKMIRVLKNETNLDTKTRTLLIEWGGSDFVYASLDFYARLKSWSLDAPLSVNASIVKNHYHIRSGRGFYAKPWSIELVTPIEDDFVVSSMKMQFRGILRLPYDELRPVGKDGYHLWNSKTGDVKKPGGGGWSGAEFMNGLVRALPSWATPTVLNVIYEELNI